MIVRNVRKIADHYGSKHQSIKAMEELSELTKEIAIQLNCGGRKGHMVEEIADVKIMIEQLIYIYDLDKERIRRTIDDKVERTLKRIETKKEERTN